MLGSSLLDAESQKKGQKIKKKKKGEKANLEV